MKQYLSQLAQGRSLSVEETVAAFELIMSGAATPAQIGSLLSFIAARGPTRQEIVGAATVMRSKVVPIAVPPGMTVIDTCGTGGTHSPTFNVSTAAALVVAAAGRPHNIGVAKHGNRSVTSKSGSSQVLEQLGVRLDIAPATATRCLDETGFCFCFAPAHHPAMKYAAPVRGELGFRTLFNLLGPLTNPAGAARQVMGVYDPALTELIAQVLRDLGSCAAMVVHGQAEGGGLGEVTTTGPTRISRLCDGQVTTTQFDAGELGLAPATVADLSVADPAASAAVIRHVLEGRPGAARDMVCLNAAAALMVAGVAADWVQGLEIARQAIDRGGAKETLAKVIAATRSNTV
ncbi:MAG: anthranilate phosphoribosyltransferase [Phycisphaeraceae bacterium]